MSNKIVELMQVAPEEHDLAWLQESLQAAVELEFATLPPYLSGAWSIKNRSAPANAVAYNLILSVALEEMLHMGLACNMLVAVGGTPAITAPPYPGPLPGGVRPGLEVYLSGLTQESVEMFMAIELPEEPVALLEMETFPTIGAFYDAISDAFGTLQPTVTPAQLALQVQTSVGGQNVFLIHDFTDAQNAIKIIKEQGEGVPGSPDVPTNPGEFAHYYRFGEIARGHKLVQAPDGTWGYTGDPVPFPEVFPVAQVPAGGYGTVTAAFNTAFGRMIASLETAWKVAGAGLGSAVGDMFGLEAQAAQLVSKALPEGQGPGNYGPDFIPIFSDSTAPATPTIGEPGTSATTIGFKHDVLPLFTATDISHMKDPNFVDTPVPLDDFSYMSQPDNAQAVLDQVKSGSMPPGSPWSAPMVATFQQWIDDGLQP